MTWARRIGVVGGLVLAGVSVAFAAQALQPRQPGQTLAPGDSAGPSPSHALVAALAPPVLDASPGLTRVGSISVSGKISAELPAGGPYKVRIYVNDRLRADARIVRRDTEFTVADVPLTEGDNTITAAIAGQVDETARSAPITVERDSTPPPIDVTSPAGSIVYGETMLMSGTTEPQATVRAFDRTTGAETSTTAGSGGAFSLLLALRPGSNELELTALDLAGNTSRETMTVSRQESQAAVTLTLSRDSFDVATLPQTISMVAQVVGPDGKPVDGADVTFSISPPGQMTVTHDTTTVAGSASWSDYPLNSDAGQTGRGLVTVLVTLAGGQSLAESASFTFR